MDTTVKKKVKHYTFLVLDGQPHKEAADEGAGDLVDKRAVAGHEVADEKYD